ncbi:alpha/beta hydrolase family esterase [Actinomadura rupiterrae]|uniref:alpha/beta hydrolase family esterase n=1 Tax=Actinomadura rupiterrae TaxID=559627 RepID=UPI0020A34F1E|nr:PHB depolymerase family esterase [Actinomadura rupiterrae]MCP2334909.1 polyhydroxybutyrate depolymerase [Actinomadura rupiterrae]
MRRNVLIVLAALLVLVTGLAGCDDGKGKGGAGSSGKPGGKASTAVPQDVDGIPTASGTHKQKLDVGTPGHREFLLHVPPGLADRKWKDGRPDKPLPLVIALHGGLANMSQMESLTGFDKVADDKGFLVAYPDGFLTTWNAGDCCGAAKFGKIDDVGFLTKLINRLNSAGLTDPKRVYVTGFSNGAGMAYKMGCDAADKVAAIGVVEGALVTKCDPSRPVSTMIFHGTADRNVPFDGGGRRDINDDRPYPAVSFALNFWRDHDDLPPPKATTLAAQSGNVQCSSSGKGGVSLALCKVIGGGHAWPRGAAPMLWEFFAAHGRS